MGKMSHSTSPITTFYKNLCIFITGATGFLGKATIEKLLRTCPDVETIYVLIRPKKDSDVEARLKELLDSSLYNTIRQQNPEVLKKVIPIEGDIALPNFGISENDQQILIEKVSVVIHSAATIKFDEKPKLAVNLNVNGIVRLVKLCKQMKKLVSLVHVSTAYSNSERKDIDEVVYPPPADPKDVLKLMEEMDDEEIEKIIPNLIGNKPNTYTFTKSLGEHVLFEEIQNLPICIVRPSIVTATWKEPVPGWIDNVNGPTGMMVAIGKGIMRTAWVFRENVTDLVPLDFTVNLILISAWYTAEHKDEGIKVYNCCTGTQNPLSWGVFNKWLLTHYRRNPLSGVVWYPDISFEGNKIRHKMNELFTHYIPAYILDSFSFVTGGKPVLIKIHKKIKRGMKALDYFTTNQWRFKTDNMMILHEMLSPEDQMMFSLNLGDINWPIYMENYCLGIRKYLLKDDEKTLPAARRHVQRLYLVHNVIKFILILIIFWGLWYVYQC